MNYYVYGDIIQPTDSCGLLLILHKKYIDTEDGRNTLKTLLSNISDKSIMKKFELGDFITAKKLYFYHTENRKQKVFTNLFIDNPEMLPENMDKVFGKGIFVLEFSYRLENGVKDVASYIDDLVYMVSESHNFSGYDKDVMQEMHSLVYIGQEPQIGFLKQASQNEKHVTSELNTAFDSFTCIHFIDLDNAIHYFDSIKEKINPCVDEEEEFDMIDEEFDLE